MVPPARAQHILSSEQRCASFYPPMPQADKHIKFVKLRQQPVDLELYSLTTDQKAPAAELTALRGQRVAVLRYRKEGKFQKRLLDAGLLLTKVETISQGFKLLFANRVDHALGDELSVEYILPTIVSEHEREKIRPSSLSLDSFSIGVFVHPRCQPLFK